jgi:hypothetical protein
MTDFYARDNLSRLDVVVGAIILATSIYAIAIYTLYQFLTLSYLIPLSLFLSISSCVFGLLMFGFFRNRSLRPQINLWLLVVWIVILAEFICLMIIASIDQSPTLLFPDFGHIYDILLVSKQTYPLFTQTWYVIYTDTLALPIILLLNSSIERGLYYSYLFAKAFIFGAVVFAQLKLYKIMNGSSQTDERSKLVSVAIVSIVPLIYISGTAIRDLYIYYLAPHTVAIGIFAIVLIYVIEEICPNPRPNDIATTEILSDIRSTVRNLLLLFVLSISIALPFFVILSSSALTNLSFYSLLWIALLLTIAGSAVAALAFRSRRILIFSLIMALFSASLPEGLLMAGFVAVSLTIVYVSLLVERAHDARSILTLGSVSVLWSLPIIALSLGLGSSLLPKMGTIISYAFSWSGIANPVTTDFLGVLLTFYLYHFYFSLALILTTIVAVLFASRKSISREINTGVASIFLFTLVSLILTVVIVASVDALYRPIHYLDAIFSLLIPLSTWTGIMVIRK